MRALFIASLLMFAAGAQALDTSMILRPIASQTGGFYAVVNPGLGTITLYAVEGSQLCQYSSANFLSDLAFLDGRVIAERKGIPFSTLRVGSENCLPTVDGDKGIITQLPAKPTPAEEKAGLKSYRDRVRLAEDEFWSKDHPYDGVVRGAMGAGTIMLVVPAKHALLIYDYSNQDKGPQLKAWRNYGAELYVQTGFATSPTPEEIRSKLPPDIQEEYKKTVEESTKAMIEKGGAIQLSQSDPWVTAGAGDRYAILDTANKRIMSYEWTGKVLQMQSVRNTELDLLIPTAINSNPNEQAELDQYKQTRKARLKDIGIDLDMASIKALVGQKAVTNAKAGKLQAAAGMNDVVLDYTDLHKLFVYRLQGANNNLELAAMRDYTLDVGLALQDAEFQNQDFARVTLGDMKTFLAGHNLESAMLSMKFALKLDPHLYKEIEKGPGSKDLKKHPDWQATLDAAMKAAEKIDQDREERRKKSEEEKKKKLQTK